MIESDFSDNEYIVIRLSTMQIVGTPYERSCDAHDAAVSLTHRRHNDYAVFQRQASYRWGD